MTLAQRIVLAVVALGASLVLACVHHAGSTLAGPTLGESTAVGPKDPSATTTDAGEVIEVSGALRHPPGGQPQQMPGSTETPPSEPPSEPPQGPGVFSPPPDAGS
jgi:hypothetical protein